MDLWVEIEQLGGVPVFNRSMSDPSGQYRCKLAETGGGLLRRVGSTHGEPLFPSYGADPQSFHTWI